MKTFYFQRCFFNCHSLQKNYNCRPFKVGNLLFNHVICCVLRPFFLKRADKWFFLTMNLNHYLAKAILNRVKIQFLYLDVLFNYFSNVFNSNKNRKTWSINTGGNSEAAIYVRYTMRKSKMSI